MTTKTQTSSMAMKTLRGVFEQQPKMNHRRDFLRENKLNLRELQKNTTHKLTAQKQEQDRRHNKHLQKYQKSQEPNEPRRSASQCRNVERKDNRQTRIAAGGDNAGVGNGSGRQSFRRAYSQQRESREHLQPSIAYEQHAGDSSSCCCVPAAAPTKQHQTQHQQTQHNPQQQHHNHPQQHHNHPQQQHNHQHHSEYIEHVPRSASNASVLSKAESCDREMQTEDINDEDFLYEALKKCSFSDVHHVNKQKALEQMRNRDNSQTRSNASHHSHSQQHQQQHDHGLKSIYSREQGPFEYHDHYQDNKSQPDQIYTSRSQSSIKLNGHNHENDIQDDGPMMNEDLEHNFQNLKIDSNMRREQEQQLSARSRQTLCSTTSKKTTNSSNYKLGCRDDLRLPRYLEKEKREKEEERIREINRDPNCPLGHYALSEHERLTALQNTKQKMSSLVNELNHMPMTTETLRIRNRKVEIEKELQRLEQDIRTYSKQKVYVTEPSIQY